MSNLETKRLELVTWLKRHGYTSSGNGASGRWEKQEKKGSGRVAHYRVELGTHAITQYVERWTWGGPKGLAIQWHALRDGFISEVSITAEDKLSGLDKVG